MTVAVASGSALSAVQVLRGSPLRTDGEVLALTFAPDGSLWSVEEGGLLRHWDGGSGNQIAWHALSEWETLWCFSREAGILASASNDVTLWNPANGEVMTALPQKSWVTALAFFPDPAFLATGHDDGSVRFWDAPGRRLIREFRLHKRPISALAFSPDGDRIALASEDKTISLWQVADGKCVGVVTGHTDRIPALAWHPDGDRLVSAGWDTTARVWDLQTLQPVVLLNTHASQVTALAFSRDGGVLASSDSDLQVHVWDFAAHQTRHVLRGPGAEIRCLAFSRDGKRLACGGEDRIHVWDPASGVPLAVDGTPQVCGPALALSPDGRRIAVNGGGFDPRLVTLANHAASFPLEETEPVHALAFTPDGQWLAGAAERHVRLWDAQRGEAGRIVQGPEEPLTCLAFNADSTLLAAGSSAGLGVWLWSLKDGEPALLIPDALDGCTVAALAFHPRGRLLAAAGIDWLATGGSDGAVALWDIAQRCEIATFPAGSTAIAFDPSGSRLAIASLGETLHVWDVQKQETLFEISGHDGPIRAVAYSPDGALLASAGDDRTLRLWDQSGQGLGLWEADSQIKTIAFSPDGRCIFTAHANMTCSRVEIR